jgi:hypothetical protein
MPAYLFQHIVKRGTKAGYQLGARDSGGNRERQSLEWYRKEAGKLSSTIYGKFVKNQPRILKDETAKFVSRVTIGKLYAYTYDPKWKEVLPYYDIFPMVFPVDKAKGGFLGINLHYLPVKARAVLMDQLYQIETSNTGYARKLDLSYALLKSASRYSLFKPCLKHYLTNFVRSRFLMIHPDEWDLALMMPVHKFRKKSAKYVWAESERIWKSQQ